MAAARLFFIVGASGAGKDTLIQHARRALAVRSDIAFAHRYITRPVRPGGENHIALTDAEFASRLRRGLFAMHWEGHGWRYGIGIEVDQWLAKGCDVVVNGSRAYIADACRRYPQARVIWITADAQTIAGRLAGRGRESAAELAERFARNAALPLTPECEALRVENDGPLEDSGARLVWLLTRPARLL